MPRRPAGRKSAAMTFEQIAVIGGGAWGTALALTCTRAGRSVSLWESDPANAAHLAVHRESRFLPGVRLDDRIALVADLAEAARAQAILLVVPAQAVRAVTKALSPLLAPDTPVIVCAKGIERGTQKFMTEVVGECAPGAMPAILSGPSFAADVARGLPTAVTLAAADEALGRSPRQGDRLGDLSALPLDRRARRRAWRRRQERARHRGRRRHRTRARRKRTRGADHPRLRRARRASAGLMERSRKR